MNHPTLHPKWRWAVTAGLALLVLILAAGSQPEPVQASLYWAAANGVTPSPLTLGIQSNTPIVCFVGNAVDVRLARVTQIIQYIHQFELAGNIRFMSRAGHPLADELSAGGNIQNLKCTNPTILGGGNHYYSGDIRVVIPGTNVDATDPIPGVGCATDKLKSAPSCIARDGTHIDCFARGYDDSTWGKHWDSTNGWTDWDQALGGTTNAPPAVASLSASNLEVISKGVSDSALYIRTWNGTTWTSWAAISGTSGNATSGAACVGHDTNHLTCSVRWSNGNIYVADRVGGVWGSWINTGMATPANTAPSITTWGSGRLDIFARGLVSGGQAEMTHVWSTNYGASWTSVEPLGGNIIGAPACIGRQPSGSDGKLDCFARGADGNIWKRSYPGGSVWGSWGSLFVAATSDPAVTVRSGTSLDVLYAGPNGALWQISSSNGGSAWNMPADLGDNNSWGSWSNPPWTRDNLDARACMYNLKLGDNPWCPVGGEFWPCASNPENIPYLDHTLHEFGHAMGLAHEHKRDDTLISCSEPGYGGSASNGKLTPYDRYSVMNYSFPACGIEGNYGYNGLSYYDRLGLRMMYPPAGFPAEFSGKLTIQSGQTLNLSSAWKDWGANMPFVAHNFIWSVDAVTRSTTPTLSLGGLSVGNHTLSLTFDDFLDRHYSYGGTVRVRSAAQYADDVAFLSAQNMMLGPATYLLNLPTVLK